MDDSQVTLLCFPSLSYPCLSSLCLSPHSLSLSFPLYPSLSLLPLLLSSPLPPPFPSSIFTPHYHSPLPTPHFQFPTPTPSSSLSPFTYLPLLISSFFPSISVSFSISLLSMFSLKIIIHQLTHHASCFVLNYLPKKFHTDPYNCHQCVLLPVDFEYNKLQMGKASDKQHLLHKSILQTEQPR